MQWSNKQWTYRFKTIWSFSSSPRRAILLWLIVHKAVWTGAKALKIGYGDGVCARCRVAQEDIRHLFFECPFNSKYLHVFNEYITRVRAPSLSAFEILLGECSHLDVWLWHDLRSAYLFNVWKERDSAVFARERTSHLFAFVTEARM